MVIIVYCYCVCSQPNIFFCGDHALWYIMADLPAIFLTARENGGLYTNKVEYREKDLQFYGLEKENENALIHRPCSLTGLNVHVWAKQLSGARNQICSQVNGRDRRCTLTETNQNQKWKSNPGTR